METLSPLFLQKAKQIKVLLTDVDGVMTNNTLSFFTDNDGQVHEIKHVESLDGMGLMFLASCGLITGIVSRGTSRTLEFWADVLGMQFLFYNTSDKRRALAYVCEHTGVTPEEVAFIGDDIIDLGLLEQVGLPMAVANSVSEVKKVALYTSPRSGGKGAVRDIAEQILRARGLWDGIVESNRNGTFQTPKHKLCIVKGL